MGIPWYENLIWEKEHQDFLKGLYREQLTGAVFVRPVRRIICGGCGCVFYTQVHSNARYGAKYCSNACRQKAYCNRNVTDVVSHQNEVLP